MQLAPGEDSVSYERHLKHLQMEFLKTHRNPQKIAELMLLTYPLRREEILNKDYSLNKLFEKFPFLQEVEHVSLIIN